MDHVYNDKIRYYKDNIIVDEIPNNQINPGANIKNYDLQFLDDKLIIKEQIFDDMNTNIEEELLNEMIQISNVAIEMEEQEQNSKKN